MNTPSYYVIGRGIAGLTVAYELQRAGRAVVVVGPAARAGTATRAAVGVCAVKGNNLAGSPLFAAKLAAQRALPAWLSELARHTPRALARQTGTHEAFSSLTEYEAIRERVFHRKFTGCHAVKVLGPKALRETIHSAFGGSPFTAGVRGSFYYPDDLWYDPVGVLEALEAFLRAAGVPFLESEVRSVRPHPDRGLEIETETTSVWADEVVLAAGIFASEILAGSGWDLPPLEAVAGETLVGHLAPSATSPSLILNRGKINFVLDGRRWIFGSSSRNLAPGAVAGLSSLSVEEMRSRLAMLALPDDATEVLWGVRARFRDQSPVVGSLAYPGQPRRLWLALGFHKSGLQLAPYFAQKMVASLDDPAAFSALSAFSSQRFGR